jgi:Zn-dependent peptidase ImmA (M78 family)
MTIEEIIIQAEEIAKKYNPTGLSPFPFENIVRDKGDLFLYETDVLKEQTSGAIFYDQDKKKFVIAINQSKPKTRKYFTTAHELGHYFLHQEIIKREDVLIDGENTLDGTNILYRLDEPEKSKIETEANNFAASLIMPSELVEKAWNTFHSVEECANIFNVSVAAMSIRLERLGLVE